MSPATLLPTVACCLVAIAAAAERPASLVRNGGCEQSSAWTLADSRFAEGGNPGRCLRIVGAGAAIQDVLVARQTLTLTVAVDVLANGVKAHEGKPGYAFAAVYQTDETGRLLANHDFVQITGTQDWQRRSYTFRVDPGADYVSLRCGLFQAEGEVRFRQLDARAGERGQTAGRSHRAGESSPAAGRGGDSESARSAGTGAPSPPQTIAAVLNEAGLETRLLSAGELADPTLLNTSRFDLLVLPTGQTFPAAARLATIEFLRHGGSFLSMGGYTFNHLVRKVEGRWIEERQIVQRQLDDAMQSSRSLLADGGFEQGDPPVGGSALDGAWRRSSKLCRLVTEGAKEGRRCAQVSDPPGDLFWTELPCKPGRTYRITGWMRTRGVNGLGMAYMAVYQHDAAGKIVEFRDFAVARGTTDWQQFSYDFTPQPSVARLRIPLGLFQARGTAWFDDIRLGDVTAIDYRPMNTATGKPADGLEVAAAQIGVFDASFPLKRARSIRTAMGQSVVSRAVELSGDFQGWAASGVIGYDMRGGFRCWPPMTALARPRGAAGAMVVNYQGFYSGSCWAYFGIENVDLFRDPKSAAAQALQDVARFLVWKTFLRNLKTDHRLYHRGEPVAVSVTVENRVAGPRARRTGLRCGRWTLDSPPIRASKTVLIEPCAAEARVEEFHFPGPEFWNTARSKRTASRSAICHSERSEESAQFSEILRYAQDDTAELPCCKTIGTGHTGKDSSTGSELPATPTQSQEVGLWRVSAGLLLDGRPVDQLTSGFVLEQPAAMQSGPALRFKGNYFTLDGRPQFLFGSDTYHSIYNSASENPLTWAGELAACATWAWTCTRTCNTPSPATSSTKTTGAVPCAAQLTQQRRLVFMPGMLIGHNVAVGDRELAAQRLRWPVRRAAPRRAGAAPLHQRRLPAQRRRASAGLRSRCGTGGWRNDTGRSSGSCAVWGGDAVRGAWGRSSSRRRTRGGGTTQRCWTSLRFENCLMLRRNQAHVAAVREHDRDRPITLEYYQHPTGGIDLVNSIDGQDVCNFGFFDRPGADLENLPLQIRWNDLRVARQRREAWANTA